MLSGNWGDQRVTWGKVFLPKSDAFWEDLPVTLQSRHPCCYVTWVKWLNFSGKETFRGVRSSGNSPGAGGNDRAVQGPRGGDQIIGFHGPSAPKRTKPQAFPVLGWTKGSGSPPPFSTPFRPRHPPIWPSSSPPRALGRRSLRETCPGLVTPPEPLPRGTHDSRAPGPARAPFGPVLLCPARRGLRLLHAARGPAPAGPLSRFRRRRGGGVRGRRAVLKAAAEARR